MCSTLLAAELLLAGLPLDCKSALLLIKHCLSGFLQIACEVIAK